MLLRSNVNRGARSLSVCVAAAWMLMACPAAWAGKIVLRIKAGNPIGTPQKVEIKSSLPPQVRTNDIINLDGLELGYNIQSDVYFVHREVDLGPREVVTYDVEINDIWNISPDELAALDRQAAALVAKLENRPEYETAQSYRENMARALAQIVADQEANAIGVGVQPAQHIRAHEMNMGRLKRVKKDMFLLENLVLASGQSLGAPVMGEDDKAPKPERDVDLPEAEYQPAIIRVVVRNTSPDVVRTIDLRRDLPSEVKSFDVMDAGGLTVGVDSRNGTCYVFQDGLTLQPLEERTFDVRIRDKWNINRPRLDKLTGQATNLLTRVRERGVFTSIEETLQGLVDELASIAGEQGPSTLDESYVAFYRGQSDRIDLVERKINRISSVLQPVRTNPRWGFAVQPPSMKTTWSIIYIILVFLAIVSLLFFFRWYGRSKSERM